MSTDTLWSNAWAWYENVSSWYFKAEWFPLSGRKQSSVSMIRSMPFDTGPREWAFAILFTLVWETSIRKDRRGDRFRESMVQVLPISWCEFIYTTFSWGLFLLLAAHWLYMCGCNWKCALQILLPHYFSSVHDVIFIGGNDYFELSLTSGALMVCTAVKMCFCKQLAWVSASAKPSASPRWFRWILKSL